MTYCSNPIVVVGSGYPNRFKLGFFLTGLINNYNFIIVFSAAYLFSQNNKYINPSLLIFTEIVPGFLTQLIYPQFLYKISYFYRFLVLYFLQLISSICLLVRSPENYTLLFLSIILVSINSYLGESTMLSLSAAYDHKEMKFWSMGTGFAGLMGTGVFLLLNLWLDPKIIFGINLIVYLFGYSLGLYLLDINTKLKQVNQYEPEIKQENITVPLDNPSSNYEEFDLEKDEPEIQEKINPWKEQFKFFLDTIFLCLGYFFGYFIGFLFVPALSQNNLNYQITQFITRTSQFFGRIAGNYIQNRRVRLMNTLHLYTVILLIVYSVLISISIPVPSYIVNLTLIISYFTIGISYPIIYNNIYENYQLDKHWYLGAVGQYTSFFTILGCLIGYPIHLAWKK
jgi:battenin